MSTASGNSEAIRNFDIALRDSEQSPGAPIVRTPSDAHPTSLQLFRVHAVAEGTHEQANVSVRLEENGRTDTGRALDPDTLLAAANAYVNALNRLLVKREKHVPEAHAVAR